MKPSEKIKKIADEFAQSGALKHWTREGDYINAILQFLDEENERKN